MLCRFLSFTTTNIAQNFNLKVVGNYQKNFLKKYKIMLAFSIYLWYYYWA